MSDTLRGLLMSFVSSSFSMLVLIGLLHWNPVQISGVELVITNATLIVAYLTRKPVADPPVGPTPLPPVQLPD